jgi:hypothetical protein
VFTEWYWTPIFFAIVYGPPIAVVAGLLYVLGRFAGLRRRTRAAAALVLAPALVLGAVAVVTTLRYRSAEAADARDITFTAFAAPGFHQTRSSVFPGPSPELDLRYERGGGLLLVSQLAAEDDDLTPPDCSLHDGTIYQAWQGPCRAARTPRGRLVTLADIAQQNLFEVRDGTLIVASAYGAREDDLLALADALEPVDVDDIHWER